MDACGKGVRLWTAKIPVGSFRGPASGRERDYFLYGFYGAPTARQRRASIRLRRRRHELAEWESVN